MKRISLFRKAVVCLIAAVICGLTFLRIGDRFLAAQLPMPFIIGVTASILLAPLAYVIVWHRRDTITENDNSSIYAFWIGAIRYGIAFDLAMFGFQKIFHFQFNTPLGMLDEPFSTFTNKWLMWAYFQRSYGFGCAIGISQIIGSLLLVFNRTRLLALIMLFPIMVNIILIDYFYQLENAVLVHALILFGGIIYLLFLERDQLVACFLTYTPVTSTSMRSSILKNTMRFSILFLPLSLIALHGPVDKHSNLTGKYTVTDLKINDQEKLARQCTDSVLTTVYFDLGSDCVFEYNGLGRRMFGTYVLDQSNTDIRISWHFPQDAARKQFNGILTNQGNGEVEMVGMMNGDSTTVQLKRVNFP